jgi:hypothetical protein
MDKWKGMSRKDLKHELTMAKLSKDEYSVFLLLTLLNTYKSKIDSYSISRKKYQRVLCPICNSNSHKLKGSVIEMKVYKRS